MARFTLITCPGNHQCEKARWAMDYMGRPYEEDRHAPYFQRAALAKARALRVPALNIESGKEVHFDSPKILEWVDGQIAQMSPENRLFPADPVDGPLIRDFCTRVDREFSPEVVRFFYHPLTREQYFQMSTQGVPESEWKKFRYMGPIVRMGVGLTEKISADSYKRALRQIDKFFTVVDHLLHDGRKFLFQDRFTAADLTFCSVAALTVLPQEYKGSKVDIGTLVPEHKAEIDRLRQTRVGTYVRAVYKVYRNRSV